MSGALRRVQHDVNPARAGMILVRRVKAARQWGKPRASGDDPASRVRAEAAAA